MTLVLPALTRISSPNYSSRGGAKVRLICVHDCEGSYNGSIAWFSQARSQVSAHIVLSEDGARATQMVDWANKAWHCCEFNPISEGIEAAGYAAKGLAAAEWQALANITAYRLKANGLPPVWSRRGADEGFAQHRDLGPAGGGHSDITSDPSVWVSFRNMVEDAYQKEMPSGWGVVAALSPVTPPDMPAGFVPHPHPRHDHQPPSLAWVQMSLNALKVHGPVWTALVVDGIDGTETRFAVRKFQRMHGLAVDGDAGPLTCAELSKAVAAATKST